MKAVDTNVLARYILNDDPVQSKAAEKHLAAGVFVPITVLLETGWLLASRYGFGREQLASTLDSLLDVPTIQVGDEDNVRQAIAHFRTGADLADMIHLVAADGSDTFLTFDRALREIEGTTIRIELA